MKIVFKGGFTQTEINLFLIISIALCYFSFVNYICSKIFLFLLNNLWNLWWGGERFFIRFRNIFPMLVFTFLLHGGLNQMMLLFRCFLVLAVFTLAWYWSLRLYLDLPKVFWYGITESLKISSEEEDDESRDLIESGSCLRHLGMGWQSRWRFLLRRIMMKVRIR